MEGTNDAQLHRTSSQTSSQNSSCSGRKNSTVRVPPRKHSSKTSLQQNEPLSPQKSLTSFPSLSPTPDDSPVASRRRKFDLKTSSEPTSILNREPNVAISATVRKVSKSLVGSLVATPASATGRTALFDDAPQDTRNVPGNLHYATDEQIKRMMEQSGTIPLIRQLADDLAQRDAQVTMLRRKAEERERVLKKMLQECEVSNLDIETRLRAIDLESGNAGSSSRKSESNLDGTHAEDTMDKRLQLAMEDNVSDYDSLSLTEDMAIAATTAPSIDSTTTEGPAKPQEPRNWKTYMWTGPNKKASRAPSLLSNSDNISVEETRSRSNSGPQKARKALRSDLFTPPTQGVDGVGKAVPNLRRLQSQDVGKAAVEGKGSTSMTSWALKLVAGGNPGSKGADKDGKGSMTRRPGSIRTSSSGSSTTVPKPNGQPKPKARGPRSSLGPNGTVKGVTPEVVKTANLTSTSPHRVLNRGSSNLGPVEMDTILPEDSRPPTLTRQFNNMSNDQDIDPFGFIYNLERKKRQSEAAAALRKTKRRSNVESLGSAIDVLGDMSDDEHLPTSPVNLERPGSKHSSTEEPTNQVGKRWHDFLKIATFPTELLSHTPSTAPITTIEVAVAEPELPRKPSHVIVQKSGSVPALSINPEPAPSRISSGNAEFAKPPLVTTPTGFMPHIPNKPQPDPVKALLEQLTDLHDTLQRDKTVKWNEFLRKVRAERKREGEAVASGEGRAKGLTMPEALLLDGEIVGVASLGNKGKVGRAKWQDFRELVLSGIPVTYRAKVWAECCGASSLRIPGYYDDLIKNGTDDPNIASQIHMDITRTLTNNIFFREGPGVAKLNEVLLAYSRRNTEVGYCQGMNLITACLLLIMPTAEDAFWILASMIENILPNNYYDHSLLTSRADQVVLRSYVAELLPKLSGHLDELGIELEALTFQWFLSVFTDCLSAEALFRVWDVVLCMHDGSTFLFQVALALLKLNERALLGCDNPAAIYHYINHQMTNHAISIDGLIRASDGLKNVVKRKEVEERRARAVEHELEVMEQREEVRRLRSLTKTISRENEPEEDRSRSRSKIGALATALSRESSRMGSVSSTHSLIDDDEALIDDLQNLTPMPTETEMDWRA